MTDDLSIRTGTPTDAGPLAQFNMAMAWETERKHLDPPTVARGVRAVLDNPEHGFYIVAVSNHEAVGSLLVTFEWSDWRSGLFWWIQSLYVRPEFRRRGVFRRLYEFVRTKASQQPDVCGIRLYVEQSNQVAQQTYADIGMDATPYRVYEELF